jgi:hypothetical protein
MTVLPHDELHQTNLNKSLIFTQPVIIFKAEYCKQYTLKTLFAEVVHHNVAHKANMV